MTGVAGPQLAPSFFSPKRPCRLHARALLAAPEGASKVRVKVMDTLPWILITQARILYLSSHDNVRKVYVQGRLARDKDA